ncbi:MAG: FecR domain-containing protein [Hahellaceae bacterium]|nr:FecR domain-containing protein [Hahellaceae bacterium]
MDNRSLYPTRLLNSTQLRRSRMLLQALFQLFFLWLTLGSTANAEALATVTRIEGDVRVFDAEGRERRIDASGAELSPSDTLVTGEHSRVSLKHNDGSATVLEESSGLLLSSDRFLRYLSGKIYFVMSKIQPDSPPKTVSTVVATIGIRGTTFTLYDENAGNAIALKEGLLNIEAPDKPFEFMVQQQANEFDAFKQERINGVKARQDEFQEYLAKQQQAFIEYKKEFLLEANRVVSFDGRRVQETELSNDILDDFTRFEAFLGETTRPTETTK